MFVCICKYVCVCVCVGKCVYVCVYGKGALSVSMSVIYTALIEAVIVTLAKRRT